MLGRGRDTLQDRRIRKADTLLSNIAFRRSSSTIYLSFNTQLHIIHVDVHHHAKEDLDLIWESNPEAAATVLVVLEQLEADPKAIDKLTTYGDNNAGATLINVKPWQSMRKKADLWRFRALDTPATSYRVIYGYQWQTRQLCVLAVVHKEEFDYDELNSPLALRIITDWRAL